VIVYLGRISTNKAMLLLVNQNLSANKLSKAKGNHDFASSTRNYVSSAISQEGIEDLANMLIQGFAKR